MGLLLVESVIGGLPADLCSLNFLPVFQEVAVIARQVFGDVAEAWLVGHAKVAKDGALLLRQILSVRREPLVRDSLAHHGSRGGTTGSGATDLPTSSRRLG